MPPTILLPHPGGTGSPSLDRITYIPGPQTPFPHRAFNPASISPGEDPTPPLLSNTGTSPSSPGGGALETCPSLLLWDQFCCFNRGSFFHLKLTTAVFCTTMVEMRCYSIMAKGNTFHLIYELVWTDCVMIQKTTRLYTRGLLYPTQITSYPNQKCITWLDWPSGHFLKLNAKSSNVPRPKSETTN